MTKLQGLNSIDVTMVRQLADPDTDLSNEHPERLKLLEIVSECHEQLLGLEGVNPEPEIVDYMWHVVRLHEIVGGALGSVPYNSILSLDLLWRCVFEQQLAVAIILGNDDLSVISSTPPDEGTVRTNLCAHLAWCLWHDYRYSDLSIRWIQRDPVWNEDFAREMTRNERLRVIMNHLWGDSDYPSAQKTSALNREIRDNTVERRNRTLRLLNDDGLRDWYERIRENRPRSFFELVKGMELNVSDLMQGTPLYGSYGEYLFSSAQAHGSTFSPYLSIADDCLTPVLFGINRDARQYVAIVRRFATNVLRGLELVRHSLDLAGAMKD